MSILAPGNGALVVLTTTSTREEAERLVQALVGENLAACGTIVGPATSIYRWQGRLCNESEHVVVLKTRRERVEEMAARLKSLHGYECPEILALPVEAGHDAYLSWLVQGTTRTEEDGGGARH